MENALKILLSCDEIDPDIYNSQGQKAQEVVADNEKKNEIIKLFVNYYNNQSAKKTDMNNNASMQKK
jgi:methionine salvage enolase-phosphatase E1